MTQAQFLFGNLVVFLLLTHGILWLHYRQTDRRASFAVFALAAGNPGWLTWWRLPPDASDEQTRRFADHAINASIDVLRLLAVQAALAVIAWHQGIVT